MTTSPELAAFLREATDDRPLTIVESVCAGCDGRVFEVAIHEDDAARRTCVACGTHAFLADSEEHWSEEGIGYAACPCDNEEFEAAVGLTTGADGEVRWVTVALRCTRDGATGVYADWKIDYAPTAHLLPVTDRNNGTA